MRRYGAGETSIEYKSERVDFNKALTVARLYKESDIDPTVENVLHVKNLKHLECFRENEVMTLMNKLYKLYGKKEVVDDGLKVVNMGSYLAFRKDRIV